MLEYYLTLKKTLYLKCMFQLFKFTRSELHSVNPKVKDSIRLRHMDHKNTQLAICKLMLEFGQYANYFTKLSEVSLFSVYLLALSFL